MGLLLTFANYTKFNVADGYEGCHRIHQDIDWVQKWQIDFNPSKCDVLHFRKSNIRRNYTVNSKNIHSVDVQRDIEVKVHSSMQVATQVQIVVKKTYVFVCLHQSGHCVHESGSHFVDIIIWLDYIWSIVCSSRHPITGRMWKQCRRRLPD